MYNFSALELAWFYMYNEQLLKFMSKVEYNMFSGGKFTCLGHTRVWILLPQTKQTIQGM